ncbi:MAG: ABC transporter permease [Acidobacteria bacterium]|nr:ABC transporter permease [Acidobacteriota bacterium]
MHTLWRDIRYGFRTLLARPGFFLAAIVTIGLGIGANTAVFSVINAVLLRSLPYPEPERLVILTESTGADAKPVAFPNFLDWRKQSQSFEQLTAYSATDFTLSGIEQAERIDGELVSDGYFDLLGMKAGIGRTFSPEETTVRGTHSVVLISYQSWKNRFGGDVSVLGKVIKLNEVPLTIIGVMPESFKGFSGAAQVWVPMMMRDALWPQVAKYDFLGNRDIHWHRVIGRLKPAVTVEQAHGEMERIGVGLAQAYPKENANRGIFVFSAKERLIGNIRPTLWMLFGAVGFILLIACSNVSNLLLARAVSQTQETAIRMALGAARSRILRQILTESLMLSLVGGSLGAVIAYSGIDLLIKYLPIELPKFAAVRVDWQVLGFTLFVSTGIGLTVGLFSSLAQSNLNLTQALKENLRGTGTGSHRHRVRNILIVGEIALALMLTIGAGLLLKSFQQLQSTKLGFNPDNLALLRFDVPAEAYKGDSRPLVGQRLLEAINQVPGLESTAITFTDLFLWNGINRGFTIEGKPAVLPSEADTVYFHDISPNFFNTLQVPFVAGRDFTLQDNQQQPLVAIVSESFARRYWPAGDALGKRVKYGPADSKQAWISIVGIVKDAKYQDLRENPAESPVVYVPLLQSEVVVSLNLVARTKGDPAGVMAGLKEAIRQFDPNLPVYNFTTVEARISDQAGETRAYAFLMSAFAVVGVALALIGIYGLVAYAVTQRQYEIGIRMALGAQRSSVLNLILTSGLRLSVIGIAIGVVGAVLLSRFLATLLFEVSPTDVGTYVLLSGGLIVCTALACLVPALRATRIDPLRALRCE